MKTFDVCVLQEGYSQNDKETGIMKANGSCTLIRGESVVMVVDTLSPWDRELLTEKLKEHDVNPKDVTHVVCTHGHPDHTGNNNLFTCAEVHVVGHAVYHRDTYYDHQFSDNNVYQVRGRSLYIFPSPGHTLDSVSVMVNARYGRVCCAGDTFEKKEDLTECHIWKDAGSENEVEQVKSRAKILLAADYVVPGHGEMFKVTAEMKVEAQKTLSKFQSQRDKVKFGLFG